MKKIFIFIFFICLQFVFSTSAEAIRIGLQDNVVQTYFATSDGGVIYDNETGEVFCKVAKMKSYRVKASNGQIVVLYGDQEKKLKTGIIYIL